MLPTKLHVNWLLIQEPEDIANHKQLQEETQWECKTAENTCVKNLGKKRQKHSTSLSIASCAKLVGGGGGGGGGVVT